MAETGGVPEGVVVAERQLVPNFASFYGESLLPPSDEGKRLTPEEFQQQFPVRYDIWNTLSQNLTGHFESGVSIHNPDDVQRLKTRLHILNRLDKYITDHHSGENGQTLRGRQINVFEDIRDHLEQGETSGYIKLPTGTGKTVLFTEIIEATDLKTLIVVPRELLVNQTVKRLEQFAPGLEVGKVFGKIKERGKQVEVTTYDMMLADVENGRINPKDYDLLVLDEVHKGLSDRRKQAIGQFTDSIKLGFSATPVFSEQKQAADILGKEIHSMTVREAVEENMLAPFSVYLVRTSTDLSNVKVTSGGDYDQGELEKAINQKERNLAAVQMYQELMKDQSNQNQLTMAYCAGVQHAQALAAEFQSMGIPAAAVYGNQNSSEQRQILEDYEAGRIKVLCNAKLLLEGYDEPKTGIIINAAPTGSAVDAEQRGGRGLRLDPDNPNKHAIIVDIVDQTSNRRFLPITFAQIVDGAYVHPTSRGSSNGKRYSPGDPIKIDVEGIEVITDPEEVMRVLYEMQKTRELKITDSAPPGWRLMGNYQNALPGTLSHDLGRTRTWINNRLDKVLKGVAKQREDDGILPEDQEPLTGKFLDSTSKPVVYYAPVVFDKLKELAEQLKPAPEGWMVIGDSRTNLPGRLSFELGKGSHWVEDRLPQVLEAIRVEQEEQGIPEEKREIISDEFLNDQKKPAIYYAPIVFERLQQIVNKEKLAAEENSPPSGWKTVGELNGIDNISKDVGRPKFWVVTHMPEVLKAIIAEQEEQGIPEEEREVLSGEYFVDGRSNTYYSPSVQEKLKKLADEIKISPEGWLPVGNKNGSKFESIANTLNQNSQWVQTNIQKIIGKITQEQDELGIALDDREPLSGEFLGKSGRIVTHYSPEVISRLVSIAEKRRKK